MSVKIGNFNLTSGRSLIKRLKVNHEIKSFKIHLINENGKPLGTMDKEKALQVAEERNLDLVEVSPNANPPVCRLMDYGRYKYQQIKKEHKQKTKTKQKEMKNIRLSVRIETHDLTVKLKQAEKFLTKGHKVKVVLILKGREVTYTERGFEVINDFVNNLASYYQDKEGPIKEKNIIQIILDPKH